jgi:hypothetical protein
MLQRAASNAYSWWWASHIRTTQSKWLDANLQGAIFTTFFRPLMRSIFPQSGL